MVRALLIIQESKETKEDTESRDYETLVHTLEVQSLSCKQ